MITGSYYEERYYIGPSGSPWPPTTVIPIPPKNDRILICPSCKANYILSANLHKDILLLECEKCGGSLEFK